MDCVCESHANPRCAEWEADNSLPEPCLLKRALTVTVAACGYLERINRAGRLRWQPISRREGERPHGGIGRRNTAQTAITVSPSLEGGQRAADVCSAEAKGVWRLSSI